MIYVNKRDNLFVNYTAISHIWTQGLVTIGGGITTQDTGRSLILQSPERSFFQVSLCKLPGTIGGGITTQDTGRSLILQSPERSFFQVSLCKLPGTIGGGITTQDTGRSLSTFAHSLVYNLNSSQNSSGDITSK